MLKPEDAKHSEQKALLTFMKIHRITNQLAAELLCVSIYRVSFYRRGWIALEPHEFALMKERYSQYEESKIRESNADS